jgi:hypothetical protein
MRCRKHSAPEKYLLLQLHKYGDDAIIVSLEHHAVVHLPIPIALFLPLLPFPATVAHHASQKQPSTLPR